MAMQAENEFTSYTLTYEEELESQILNLSQKMGIRNKMSLIALEKIYLEPDPESYAKYLQQEAHSKGMIDAYQGILDASDIAEATKNNPD